MARSRRGFDLAYSMLDLFCCGLAGGVLLFFLVIQNVDRTNQSGAGVSSSKVFIIAAITPSSQSISGLRPVFIVRPPNGEFYEAYPHRFRAEGSRLVLSNAPGTTGGSYEMLRPSPWEPRYNFAEAQGFLMEISSPIDGPWCLGVMFVDTRDQFTTLASDAQPKVSVLMRVFASTLRPTFAAPQPLGPGDAFVIGRALDLGRGTMSDAGSCAIGTQRR